MLWVVPVWTADPGVHESFEGPHEESSAATPPSTPPPGPSKPSELSRPPTIRPAATVGLRSRSAHRARRAVRRPAVEVRGCGQPVPRSVTRPRPGVGELRYATSSAGTAKPVTGPSAASPAEGCDQLGQSGDRVVRSPAVAGVGLAT